MLRTRSKVPQYHIKTEQSTAEFRAPGDPLEETNTATPGRLLVRQSRIAWNRTQLDAILEGIFSRCHKVSIHAIVASVIKFSSNSPSRIRLPTSSGIRPGRIEITFRTGPLLWVNTSYDVPDGRTHLLNHGLSTDRAQYESVHSMCSRMQSPTTMGRGLPFWDNP